MPRKQPGHWQPCSKALCDKGEDKKWPFFQPDSYQQPLSLEFDSPTSSAAKFQINFLLRKTDIQDHFLLSCLTTFNLVSWFDVCECSWKQCFTSFVFIIKHKEGVFTMVLVWNGCISIFLSVFFPFISLPEAEKNYLWLKERYKSTAFLHPGFTAVVKLFYLWDFGGGNWVGETALLSERNSNASTSTWLQR